MAKTLLVQDVVVELDQYGWYEISHDADYYYQALQDYLIIDQSTGALIDLDLENYNFYLNDILVTEGYVTDAGGNMFIGSHQPDNYIKENDDPEGYGSITYYVGQNVQVGTTIKLEVEPKATGNINKVIYGNTTLIDLTDSTAEAEDVASGQVFYNKSGVRTVGTGNYMNKVSNPTANDILVTDANGQAIDSGVGISSVAMSSDLPSQATDTTLGLVKLNPNESVEVNANGQLTVGGRLGQFSGGGVFYPTNITPTNVGGSSFLMTDGAKNISVGGRTFAIMAGANLTCKSAAAGSTQYRLSNTQQNRFACFAGKNGRLAIDQTDAMTNGTALITDISFANGNPISSYFGATESDNDIIITVDRTVNPSSATTKLRIYGTSTSSDVICVGQGVGGTHGKAIVVGQSCFGGGNQIIALGNSVQVIANNSAGFGHTHLVNKQYCFAAGQGQDFTNAPNGSAAVGLWSKMSSNTLFAVGKGTAYDKRVNALEITNDGGIIVPSTSGNKKFKITVDDSGAISATEVV